VLSWEISLPLIGIHSNWLCLIGIVRAKLWFYFLCLETKKWKTKCEIEKEGNQRKLSKINSHLRWTRVPGFVLGASEWLADSRLQVDTGHDISSLLTFAIARLLYWRNQRALVRSAEAITSPQDKQKKTFRLQEAWIVDCFSIHTIRLFLSIVVLFSPTFVVYFRSAFHESLKAIRLLFLLSLQFNHLWNQLTQFVKASQTSFEIVAPSSPAFFIPSSCRLRNKSVGYLPYLLFSSTNPLHNRYLLLL
jgi:hypothetical protein